MNAFKYEFLNGPTTAKVLRVEFRRCEHQPKTWKQELSAAARHIANTAKRPLWLCFSGGMDSEVMCRTFFEHGIQFSALTLEYEEGTNSADVKRAKDWCWDRGIPHKIVRISIDKFLDSDIERYIKGGYVTDAMGKYLQLKALETASDLGGYAVVGAGILIPRVSDEIDEPSENDIYLRFNTGHTIMQEWCKKNNVEHAVNFFSATPEACLSYCSMPAHALAIENPEMLKSVSGAFVIKLMAFQTAWPDIRPRYVDFGFKYKLDHMNAVRERIRCEHKDKLLVYKLPYPELVRQLSPTH